MATPNDPRLVPRSPAGGGFSVAVPSHNGRHQQQHQASSKLILPRYEAMPQSAGVAVIKGSNGSSNKIKVKTRPKRCEIISSSKDLSTNSEATPVKKEEKIAIRESSLQTKYESFSTNNPSTTQMSYQTQTIVSCNNNINKNNNIDNKPQSISGCCPAGSSQQQQQRPHQQEPKKQEQVRQPVITSIQSRHQNSSTLSAQDKPKHLSTIESSHKPVTSQSPSQNQRPTSSITTPSTSSPCYPPKLIQQQQQTIKSQEPSTPVIVSNNSLHDQHQQTNNSTSSYAYQPKEQGSPVTKKFYDSSKTPTTTKLGNNNSSAAKSPAMIPFSWETYLDRIPAKVAPKEAFMQTTKLLENKFFIGMKLEARDPKKDKSGGWSLATVVAIEGRHRIRLRFDGSDSMSDVFELIDSKNIAPYGTNSTLYPPMAYRGNIAGYSKFVERTVTKPEAFLAPKECFYEAPDKPASNLFEVGMKLEAVDRKNAHLIYPATIGEVHGNDVRIIFDGWKGSFDYECSYYSRDIFPINWCRDTNHPILPPKGWENVLSGRLDTSPLVPDFSKRNSQLPEQSTKVKLDRSNSGRINGTPTRPATAVRSSPVISTPKRSASFTQARGPSSATIQPHQRNTARKNATPHHALPDDQSGLGTSKKGQKRKPSPYRTVNQTAGPKNRRTQESMSCQGQDQESINFMADLIGNDNNEDDVEDGNDYIDPNIVPTCQRTVSYPEWRTSKLDRLVTSVKYGRANSSQVSEATSLASMGSGSTPSISFETSGGRRPNSIADTQTSTSFYQQEDQLSASAQKESNAFKTEKHLRTNGSVNLSPKNSGEVPTGNVSSSSINDNSYDNFDETIPFRQWNVIDLLKFIKSRDASLIKYADVFLENEIDGRAFILLTENALSRDLGMKLGPKLKFIDLIEQVKKRK